MFFLYKLLAIAIAIVGFIYLLGIYSFFERRRKDDEK